MLRVLAHEGAAEFERVLAGRPCHLVDEAFHVHAVLVGVDAAPRADRHVRIAHRVLDEQVRHGVAELRVTGLLGVPLELAHVLAVDDGRLIRERVDRLPGHAHVQPDEIAVRVEAGRHPALRDRPVEVVRHVLFAAPDHLDRDPRKLLGDGHRLAHVVLRAAAPSESAAEVVPVDLAFRERQARGLRQGGQRGLRVLGRHPHLGLVGRDPGGAVHRLHGRVGEERRAVDRLDLSCGALDRLGRVAVLTGAVGDRRRQALLEVLRDRRARLRCAGALLPDNRQRVERPLGPPPGIGDDRDRRVVDLDDAAYPGHRRNLRLVVAHERAAEHRARLDRGVQHARQRDVDRVDQAAVQLGRRVQPLQRLAGNLPIFRILEL